MFHIHTDELFPPKILECNSFYFLIHLEILSASLTLPQKWVHKKIEMKEPTCLMFFLICIELVYRYVQSIFLHEKFRYISFRSGLPIPIAHMNKKRALPVSMVWLQTPSLGVFAELTISSQKLFNHKINVKLVIWTFTLI